ncbi:MAG: hypothetical protein AB7I30_18560, partial [Isosphaeraceae bacterium]
SDEWGVSPDDGLEVKLTPAQYFAYARGRRTRDQISNRRSKVEAKAEVEAPAAKEQEQEQEQEQDQPKPEVKPEVPKDDATPKPETQPDDAKAKTAEAAADRPFVDRVRDKALAVILEELDKTVAKK